ncbi:MAG: aminoacyl-tRNA hydrolase [Bacteroidetes bacterium]|jgi:ribosome-associated protein|nr:aminoacyl-tRNA hydrolase [Bacteroidota bacterium]
MTSASASFRSIHLPPHAVRFRTSRSSGPGGQNVNKLDTRVEAIIDVNAVPGLSPGDRSLVRQHLRNRLNADGDLCVVSQRSRSQWQNRQHALERAVQLLEEALRPRAPRIATRPTAGAKRRRTDSKRLRSAVKSARRRPAPDDD